MKIVYYEPIYSPSKNYYVIIFNDNQQVYDLSTNTYISYVNQSTHAINLTRASNIILSVDLGPAYDTARGVVLLYDRFGATPAAADVCLSQQTFYYRPDMLNVVTEQEILNYSERLLPLLNGSSSAGIQVLAPVTQSILSEASLLADIKTVAAQVEAVSEPINLEP